MCRDSWDGIPAGNVMGLYPIYIQNRNPIVSHGKSESTLAVLLLLV